MRRGIVLVLGALFVMSPAIALAQATSATDVTNAEVQAVRNHAEGGFDRQIKIVDVGDENIGLGILHREAQEEVQGPVNGFIHHDVTEVYYIVSGSGTLVTGGTLIDPRPFPSDSRRSQCSWARARWGRRQPVTPVRSLLAIRSSSRRVCFTRGKRSPITSPIWMCGRTQTRSWRPDTSTRHFSKVDSSVSISQVGVSDQRLADLP